jgi:hypothetical protein
VKRRMIQRPVTGYQRCKYRNFVDFNTVDQTNTQSNKNTEDGSTSSNQGRNNANIEGTVGFVGSIESVVDQDNSQSNENTEDDSTATNEASNDASIESS